MFTAWMIGVFLAVGQHLLYSSLHHQAIEDETAKIREVLYGRALAYFSKVAFGGTVIIVYRQRLWKTLRQRALSIWSIDQLFLATEDPTLFFNWETILKAPILTVIALILWLIPLATIIFSPGALTFGDFIEVSNVTINVPTLDFSAESTNDWRTPLVLPDGTKKRSVMFYNTTDVKSEADGWFDYYDQPSLDLTRVSIMSVYSLESHSLNRQDARQTSCGGNFNCTYTTSFVGPGYKCEMVANGPEDNEKLRDMGAPFNTSALVPEGKDVYYAQVDIGDYKSPQAGNLSAQGGVPLGSIPDDLGIFKYEPVLWIGYSINSTEKLPEDSPLAESWTARYDPHIFRCIHYETRYTVNWNYTEPFYTTEVTREYLSPIVDTNFTKLENGLPNVQNPAPESNFVSPHDVALYKKTAAYHAVGQLMRKFLSGRIELEPEFPGPSYPRVFSQITQTRLVSNVTSTPVEDLPAQLESFYSDAVLSLFSSPQMLVVSEESIVVNRTRVQSTFVYDAGKLWGCYAPVILLTFIILVFGMWTIWNDGTTWTVGFSRVMVTTRNQTLDDISRGACLGNNPMPLELMNTKLQFGVLNEYSDIEVLGINGLSEVGHCAFGVASELSPIIKGVPYAGLNRKARPRSNSEGRTIIRKKEKAE
ncbi:hypothetical protein P280DRAFT_494139 [Massarina eburnea CBS 473.64]|uniref:Uncharacterized protein n=1 Tax=Massarina eburnea CBS 473.64 TaxID=1395130 RepID=A0A6A6RI16_9PLEO|nr:hypothetical protein P280DRAFT_494139 [Massarina eburnea CBS 473.64]